MNEWHQVNDNGEKEQLVRYTVVLRFTYRAVEQMSLVILIPCHCLLLVSWARRKDGCPLPPAGHPTLYTQSIDSRKKHGTYGRTVGLLLDYAQSIMLDIDYPFHLISLRQPARLSINSQRLND